MFKRMDELQKKEKEKNKINDIVKLKDKDWNSENFNEGEYISYELVKLFEETDVICDKMRKKLAKIVVDKDNLSIEEDTEDKPTIRLSPLFQTYESIIDDINIRFMYINRFLDKINI